MMNALRRGLAAAAAALLPALAGAGYYQWDMVELPLSSGASCGNGTPYRFFVNRALSVKSLAVVYEGGGACWDQASCSGTGSPRASNPNGIAPDYMSSIGGGVLTPFTDRLRVFDEVQTQSWNMVYLPYCTGDVHIGNNRRTYTNKDPANPRVQYFRGKVNVAEAAKWMRANLGQPSRLFVTGFSAGGAGATATYMLLRDTLAPTSHSQLLADSGPIFPAPFTSQSWLYPSLPLHRLVRWEWGLDRADGLLPTYAALAGFDKNDLGSINAALAVRYPGDAFGYALFRMDEVYSAFSYAKFYPSIANSREAMNKKWRQDIGNWLTQLAQHANVGWHVAHWRSRQKSHCMTIIDFHNTGIDEAGVRDITLFVDSLIARYGWPMRNVETDEVTDYLRPQSDSEDTLRWLAKLFG